MYVYLLFSLSRSYLFGPKTLKENVPHQIFVFQASEIDEQTVI